MHDQRVGELLSALKGAFVAAAASGRIVTANAAAERLLGWQPGALTGRRIEDIVPERMRAAHRGGFQRFRETGESQLMGRPVRVPALGADGKERLVDLTVLPYEDPEGTLTVVAGLHPPGAKTLELLDLEKALAANDYRPLIEADA